jgi:uncharacterized membrane protein/ketosteroid isomerase-like protein
MPEIIPNVHPILVHFTIALLAIATLLFLVSAVAGRGRPLRGIDTAANWNLWLGVGITALTIAAGLQAAGSVVHDDAAHIAMMNHKFWAFGTASLFGVLALWNVLRVRNEQRVGLTFVALMLVALVGLAGTGLRGADLVFGHGLGVQSLPQAEGHSHEGGPGEAKHSHEDDAAPVPEVALSSAEAAVVAALTGYHDALTTGDAAAPERSVLPDARFVMIEGEHVNRGWADYRDNHLKSELADLAKVRFRLSGYRFQIDGALAAVSFDFHVLPKSGPEMNFGSGRATAILIRTGDGWKLQELHTS